MVSLSDIPIVGKAVDMISEAMVNAAYRGLRYMFCYKSIVNNFNSEFKNFKIEEGRVSTKVDEEKNNGKIIEKNVTDWQEEVEGIQQDSEEFLERYENRASWKCIKCVPIPNPFNRFCIGRDAEKKAEKLAELTQSGKDLLANPIARLPPVENLPKTDGEFQIFQSRKDAYEKIWKLLVSEGGPQILGIYGMPGVGKTRIAEQIWEKAKEKGVFDKVTKAVVSSGKLDVIKLQQDLAGHLNCTFESQDNVDMRASQLKQSLMNGGKVLIILDDVWREIPLNVIGIPLGNDTTSSKILLTSREENVLRGNKCIDPVKITALTNYEAWDMFKESVGTDDIPDESLARKVCDKCAGLPLVIRAVGKALMKFNSRDMWKDALERLENCEIESVPGIDAEVYACLKLSFDMLVKDAKLCLLLCSLYPEDALIPISMLIDLATGSQLVRGGQIRVRAMVALLKSSSLVLESGTGGYYFKLHDIIRDVARSIAQNDHAFIFPKLSDSRLLHITGNPELLFLEVNNNNFYFPDEMSLYQDIHTLWIGSISNKRLMLQVWKVAGMCVNLRCLVLHKIEWEVPLEQYLGKLIMLVFDSCDIRKTDFNFISEKLETLCIWRCDLPQPLNIINLKHLRKLEICDWRNDVVLVANTISSLSSCLEELHIPDGYRYQQEEDEVNNNDSISQQQQQQQQLMEISELTRLKSLKIRFTWSASPHEEHIQDLKKVFSNLSEFNIRTSYDPDYSSLTRVIDLSGKQLETDTFQILIERAQYVWLLNVDVSSSSIFNCNTAEEAFADLKYLSIQSSHTMEHVAARISHHHHIQPRTSSFFKQLTTLQIINCSAMRYLFSNSVAKCLVQLEELYVNNCNVMEAIVMNDGSSSIDGQQDIIINFPKLKSLKLSSTPQLKSFYLDNMKVIIYSTNLFDDKIAFPALEELLLDSLSISDIWGKHYFNDNASSFSKLKRLEVISCTKLETVIPLAMLHKLQNLEYLIIKDCSSVIQEVGTYDNCKDTEFWRDGFLCQLKRLELRCDEEIQLNIPCTWDLRNLEKLTLANCWWHEQQIIPSFSRLRTLQVIKSGQSTLFPVSVISSSLQQLQVLEISDCALLEDIVTRGNAEASSTDKKIIEFIQLKRVVLNDLPKLRCFMYGADYECHMPALEKVEIGNCGFSTLFPFSVISSSLQQLEAIEISNCALLEGIVEEDVRRGNAEASSSRDKKKKIIKLFHLERVTLKDLPNLRSFMYGADYECHMPALEMVEIGNCGFSTLFTFSVFSSSLQQLQLLEISDCALLEDIVTRGNAEACCTDKKIIEFIQLKTVKLKDLPKLRCFMSGADYECHMPALEKVEIGNCSAMKYLFCNSVAKCLVQLERLSVVNCNVMEAIVMNDGSNSIDRQQDIIINFPKLKSLTIESTPQLKGFYLDNKVIIYSTNMFDDKIAFPALEELRLSSLSISYIWGKHYFNDNASCFSKLKRLEVSSCTKLGTVIPLAMLHKLQNLEYLKIKDCSSVIHEVGTYDNCKDTEFWRDGFLCQLKRLELRCDEEIQLNIPCTWDLRNLKKLTLANCWWHEQQIIPSFSRLRKLKVIKSGQSTLFPFSVISSSLQQLQDLEISDCALLEDIVTRDNAEPSSRDKKQIIEFIQLKSVVLKDLPKLRCFMSGADYECHMPALEDVKIDNCGFSTLFPFSVTSSDLQQLVGIKISNCALLEGIVEEDVRRGNIEASSSRDKKKKIIKLFRLHHVTFKDLPNLRSFMYGADYECHMPALWNVEIDNCGFSTLFTCSTNLQQLYRLQVSNCKLLEYIVRDDDDDDDIWKTDDKIITTLSHLLVISLENLPDLKSFSPASRYAFNMPDLRVFTLLQCPQLVENFSSLKISTGRSIRVKSDWDKDGKKILDLNDYIKENRKRDDDSNLISDDEGAAAAGETIDSNFSTTD